MINKVYELCDTTDDEMYFPLGIYESLESVKKVIANYDELSIALSDNAEEYEEISVFERLFGMTEHGKKVMTINREEYYNEELDEYEWRTKT